MTTKESSRIRELKSHLATKAEEVERIANSFRDETGQGHMVITTEQAAAYRARLAEVKDIRGLIAAEEEAAPAFDYLNQANGPSIGTQVNAGPEGQRGRRLVEAKSLSDHFLDSDAWREMKDGGFRRLGSAHTIESSVHEMEAKDIFTLSGGQHTIFGFGQPENLGMQERMLRPGRVRDLFPAVRTTSNMIYYMRQTGFTSNARPVPERVAADDVSPATGGPTDRFGRAPRSKSSFKPFRAPIINIRHMQDAHKNVLDDEPQLRDLLDRDMVDGVKMEEDFQILWGDGDGDNLEGIFNTPGVQEYTGLSSDRASAQIRRAATRSLLAWFNPNGIVVHPYDWENIELEQDKQGGYVVAVSIALGGEKQVWRMKLIDTSAMAQGQFLLGSFGYGAKLFDRAETTVSVSTENSDNAERSAVTIIAESRVGMAVTRPESFVIGKFTDYVAA
ncbi:phage major capsid protein [Streptosporangium sp. NPDC048865]|uniref:phage major capsid protein n=1 Tax=Streptosporangium sp. NPDC048865 TaxID=3155766 RepID=UPI003417074D